ncbi:PspC family transcriptional regulator [Chitinophagaceae bacterium 26-R-25]|nr:PspC family transcriptional regulator [Chitinophagaceae bacterium 26-R-25]
MKSFKHFIEWHIFGVCSYLGEKMGIATSSIRRFFIYASLLTMGSPIIFYLIYAFWINMKKYVFAAKRNPLKYL